LSLRPNQKSQHHQKARLCFGLLEYVLILPSPTKRKDRRSSASTD
jgi:hypothetical protein